MNDVSKGTPENPHFAPKLNCKSKRKCRRISFDNSSKLRNRFALTQDGNLSYPRCGVVLCKTLCKVARDSDPWGTSYLGSAVVLNSSHQNARCHNYLNVIVDMNTPTPRRNFRSSFFNPLLYQTRVQTNRPFAMFTLTSIEYHQGSGPREISLWPKVQLSTILKKTKKQ